MSKVDAVKTLTVFVGLPEAIKVYNVLSNYDQYEVTRETIDKWIDENF